MFLPTVLFLLFYLSSGIPLNLVIWSRDPSKLALFPAYIVKRMVKRGSTSENTQEIPKSSN